VDNGYARTVGTAKGPSSTYNLFHASASATADEREHSAPEGYTATRMAGTL